jgi:hypothetical protein
LAWGSAGVCNLGKEEKMRNKFSRSSGMLSAVVAIALLAMALPLRLAAQDQQDQDNDDPPGRAARLGHMEGSVSFQPAGENEWVEAVPNRPMTTGDKLWADRDSRADVELGPTTIHLNSNTGFSFINLDDRTVQIQLSSGAISLRVRRLDRDDVMEVDTPNQAFSIFQPGQYRVEASEDGTYTVVTVRDGEGESTGNGQTYTVHQGQRATFSGADRLNADVEQIGDPDDFDRWADNRDRRADNSRSARYVAPDVVGADDLDDYGDWQPNSEYGNVWYPRVAVGWAPYHTGHWAWIDPWGWTWVDDAPWGYAPFHYGRWAFVGSRWGWVPGPIAVRPVYAPALVVFVGGGGPAFGGNVGWFALGPREVYVPSYRVSRAYVNRVNISNTTVNQTVVTNVYNTTIVNKTTVINNVTYANRGVSGAVTAVPQGAFAGGQPVSRVAVRVTPQQVASASMNARVAVAPSQNAVLGVHANTANRVAAPPRAIQARPVVAKVAPPPPPVPFAARQQQLAAHPGQPVARQEMQRLRPANAPTTQPLVRQAPPGRPAQPIVGKPATQPATNQPGNRPGQPSANQPANRPGNPPANQPGNRPMTPPAANERPGNERPGNERPSANPPANPPANRPFEPPTRNNRPPAAQPNNRPEANPPANRPEPNRPDTNRPDTNRPDTNRPAQPPTHNDRPPVAQPNNRPEPNPPANRPEPNRPEPNRPEPNRPEPNRPDTNRSAEPPARNERPPVAQPPANRPAPPPQNTRPAEPQRQEQPQPRPQNPPPAGRPQQQTPPPPQARPQQNQPQHQPPPKQQTSEDKKHPQDPKKPQ